MSTDYSPRYIFGTFLMLPLFLVLVNLGCGRGKSTPTAPASSTPQQDAQAATLPRPPHYDEPAGLAMHVDAERAMQYTREIVAFGPRWDGSNGQQKMGAYIRSKLGNGQVEE